MLPTVSFVQNETSFPNDTDRRNRKIRLIAPHDPVNAPDNREPTHESNHVCLEKRNTWKQRQKIFFLQLY